MKETVHTQESFQRSWQEFQELQEQVTQTPKKQIGL